MLYLKEWITSEILPIKWKPPHPAHDELYKEESWQALGSFCALRVYQFCFWLFPLTRVAQAHLSYSELVLESNSTIWSVWDIASKWVTGANGLSQLQIKEHKLFPLLLVLNSLLHFIAEHVWEEKMHKKSSLMITATKGGSDAPNLISDAVVLHFGLPRLPLAMATSTWRVRHFLWLF